MSNESSMKGGESGMEQAELLMKILAEIRQQNAMLQSTIEALKEENRRKDEENERLRQIILNLQRAQFGHRSEKRTYVLDDGNQQLSLFDTPEKSEETPNPESLQNPEKEICVSGHSRKKKRTLEELCASLPLEERIVDLPDDEKLNANGQALVCIGQEYIRTELVLERAKAKVVKHYRKVYADRELEQETGYSEVFKPVMPPPLLAHSYASASVVTDVLVKKYVDAMPLYRQEQMWKRMGVALKRGAMANWVIQVADLYLRPFWKRIRSELLTQSAIHADETVMQVHKEKDRPDASESRMWGLFIRQTRGHSAALLRIPGKPKRKMGEEFPGGLQRRADHGWIQRLQQGSGSRARGVLGAHAQEVAGSDARRRRCKDLQGCAGLCVLQPAV